MCFRKIYLNKDDNISKRKLSEIKKTNAYKYMPYSILFKIQKKTFIYPKII